MLIPFVLAEATAFEFNSMPTALIFSSLYKRSTNPLFHFQVLKLADFHLNLVLLHHAPISWAYNTSLTFLVVRRIYLNLLFQLGKEE